MFLTPRSLNVQATADPTGEATRFSGEGKPRICSTAKDGAGVCGARGENVRTIKSARTESSDRMCLLKASRSGRAYLTQRNSANWKPHYCHRSRRSHVGRKAVENARARACRRIFLPF